MEEHVSAWLKASETRLQAALKAPGSVVPFLDPEATLAIGAAGCAMKPRRHPNHAKFDWSFIEGPELDSLVAEIRSVMPETAWPILFYLEADGARGNWPTLRIREVGMANTMPRTRASFSESRGDRSGAGRVARTLNDIAETAARVGSMLPPTNREVRSWSSISNITGVDFCSRENIHAKTEAEFILKKLWTMSGTEGIDQIASGDRSGLSWLMGDRFVSEEIFDLDSDPGGKVLRAEDALDQLDLFRMSQEATPEP